MLRDTANQPAANLPTVLKRKGDKMRLFHFTAAENVDAIKTEGLRPADIPRDGIDWYWPHGVVWFTREQQPVMWWGNADLFRRCVIVVLPASDKRLVSLGAWLRQHLPVERLDKIVANLDVMAPDWRSHYVYFGAVPSSRIKAIAVVQLIEDGMPA
jgi:hypothetical protein